MTGPADVYRPIDSDRQSLRGETVKNVVLIGDSIRMGYQSTVQQALLNQADVWAPQENGGTSANVLAHLDKWVLSRRPDVVHLNCGLHDLKTEFGSGTQAVPLDAYTANLSTIFRQIRQQTTATLIWAATTPVNERWHHDNKPFDRFEADVQAYNQRACEIAAQFDVQIDDLYQVAMRAGRDTILLQDGVHFAQDGYALLGQAVANAIRQHL
jgi:lysophospholipase L1-like esterase